MSHWTKRFWWAQTFERMVKTGAQSLLATVGVGTVGLVDVGWAGAFSVAGLAMLVSFLTSVASTPDGTDKESPSLV